MKQQSAFTRLLLALISFLFLSIFPSSPVFSANSVWIESEAVTSITPSTIQPALTDDGNPGYLSGGKWLMIDVSAEKVDSTVPADGITLTYTFNAAETGSYNIWNRIGFEAARSDFNWRVDGGAWATVHSTDPTTDLVELQTWNPLAWIDMGTANLQPGAHTLQIHLDKQHDAKGNTTGILYASDALCIYAGDFHPNDQYQPGDDSWISDRDRNAAADTFSVQSPSLGEQTATPLSGAWQIARGDELTVTSPSGPAAAPANFDSIFWKSMTVPGNRDTEQPEWLYAHRYWLRTKFSLPQSLADHALYLHFPSLSMTATVYVNGIQCGFDDTPLANWDCDITRAAQPGKTNELVIGIKDWYYALPDLGAVEGGHLTYEPTGWVTKYGPAKFTFPVWNHPESGIIQAPSLVVAGAVYTSDVFARASVAQKSLRLDLTEQNSSPQDEVVTIANSIVPTTGGSPALRLPTTEINIHTGTTVSLSQSAAFPNAKLWWPDSPYLYNIVTTVSLDGTIIDQRVTKFGFREWTWSNGQFALNGIAWHGRGDLADFGRADEQAISDWKQHGQNMARMWGEGTFSGLSPDQALDFFDSHGFVIRRTGIFDGEMASYQLLDGDHVNKQLFDHWRDQLLAWAKGERNHPSIFIWSIENEIAFINARVTGQSATVDPAESNVAQALMLLDPTRPVMTDGGNALLDQSLPVYGCHYIEPAFETLPGSAYADGYLASSQIWPITQSKPIIFGESYYANGDLPADLATVGGDTAFLGKVEGHPAIGLIGKMYSEGLRWNGISFQFWIGGESSVYYNSWQPVAVLCRQWDWTFGSGQSVQRMLRIFNDTHDNSPITLNATLLIGSNVKSTFSRTLTVAPGENSTLEVNLALPEVTVRTSGDWHLTLSRGGVRVFTDDKPLSILSRPTLSAAITTAPICVYDPSGVIQGFFRDHAVKFNAITSLSDTPWSAKVLLIGKDALSPIQSTSSALSAYASSGHIVIVLEQSNPLKFQGLPINLDTTTDRGEIAFIENPDHPIFAGLQQQDFFTWGPDGALYANAYAKSSAGGLSLVECGSQLNDNGLVELNEGDGLLLLCQLQIESKLASSATAQRLLLNMVRYGLNYRRVIRQTTVVASGNVQLTDALDALHLDYVKSDNVAQSLTPSGQIAIINATPSNLQTLTEDKSLVDQFTSGGGWIVLNNVTPDGLDSFDQFVGFKHVIRPFRQEKVEFSDTRNPLTIGLSPSNIVMGNGQNIFNWEAGQYPDQDAYSYVVDLDDIAPFCTSPFYGWGSITNGFTEADGYWPLITNFPAPADGTPFDIPIHLPQNETITKFTFVGDNNYWPQTGLNLKFGNGDIVPLTYDHGDVSTPAPKQVYAINPPRTAQDLTLEITGWQHLPNIAATIGIDNIYLTVKRPTDFAQRVRPMLNIGALVEYPRGAGGIILCNVKFKDPTTESNPENSTKKEAIIGAILKNLDAQFSGAKSLIAGASNVTYSPINMKLNVNQYLNEQGWFGDGQFTFADFPNGKQVLAGVPYSIYNFTTSPVPTVIMLGGNNISGNLPTSVNGIVVDQKADALFFLQAARIDQPMSANDLKNKRRVEIADYVIHYADGSVEKAPIYSQWNVDNYKQATPNPIEGAQIAWQRSYPGTGQVAVAYSMQWQNPHPDKVIQSIDLTYGPDRWTGVPCLIALTAATVH
jgi:hypothetical protein